MMSEDHKNAYIANFIRKSYKKEQILHISGEVPDKLYIIIKGLAVSYL